ncbi:MAG: hypothetical protein ABR583_03700 [Gaiellaceae bacterium]
MLTSYVVVTLLAVALLGALHLGLALAGGRQTLERPRVGGLAHGLGGSDDPWTRLLLAAALVAALFALGVVAVPALLSDDGSETVTPTEPTVTTPTGSSGSSATSLTTSTETATTSTTTRPETSTETATTSTTTRPETSTETATTSTTTRPETSTTTEPTTPPPPPPRGSIVLARVVVDGATGNTRRHVNRLGPAPIVRAVGAGVYRIVVPGLTPARRNRATVRATAGPGTHVVATQEASGSVIVVVTRDRTTGAPSARRFALTVYGARSDLPKSTLPPTT